MIALYKIIISLSFISALAGCSEVNKELGLKDDNKLEQFVEEEIMSHTGIVIDFTPAVNE